MSIPFIILYYLLSVINIIILLVSITITTRKYRYNVSIKSCEDELDDDCENDEDYFYYQTHCYKVCCEQGKKTFTKTFETEAEVVKFVNEYRESGKGVVTYIEKVMVSYG